MSIGWICYILFTLISTIVLVYYMYKEEEYVTLKDAFVATIVNLTVVVPIAIAIGMLLSESENIVLFGKK